MSLEQQPPPPHSSRRPSQTIPRQPTPRRPTSQQPQQPSSLQPFTLQPPQQPSSLQPQHPTPWQPTSQQPTPRQQPTILQPPQQPTPRQPTSQQPTPRQPTPRQPTPRQPTPRQPTPRQATSELPTPQQTASSAPQQFHNIGHGSFIDDMGHIATPSSVNWYIRQQQEEEQLQRLQLQKQMPTPDDEPGFLLVHVLSAQSICDPSCYHPYVLLTVGKITASTRPSKTDPIIWEDLFNFIVTDKRTQTLQMMVLGKEVEEEREIPIGEASIELSGLEHFQTVEKEIQIAKLILKPKIMVGTVTISLRFLSTKNPKKDTFLDSYGFPVPLEVYQKQLHLTESQYSTDIPTLLYGTQIAARKGISFPYKARQWQIFIMKYLGMDKTPFSPGLYEKLLKEKGNKALMKQIEKDVPRTFPNHPIFMSKEGRDALTRILKAFSLKNPQIGYTQAMNFIAGFLLLMMEEELAFKVLTLLIEHFVPEYYINTMTGLHSDQVVLDHLVADKLPLLYDHLKKIGIGLPIVTTKWFLCMFIHTLPFPTIIRVWDILFTQGPSTLIIVGLAILKLKEKEILSIPPYLKTSTDFMDEMTLSMYKWEDLVKQVYSLKVTFEDVKILQEEAKGKIGERVKKRQIRDLEAITTFTEEELDVLENKFSSLSVNGSVQKSNYHELYPEKFLPLLNDPLIKDQVFNAFDQDGDGTIDFRDYVFTLSTLTRGTPKSKVKLIYQILNTEKDAFVSKDQLTTLFSWEYRRLMQFKDSDEMIKASVDMALSEFDSDKDGRLSFEELQMVCLKQPGLVQLFDLVPFADE